MAQAASLHSQGQLRYFTAFRIVLGGMQDVSDEALEDAAAVDKKDPDQAGHAPASSTFPAVSLSRHHCDRTLRLCGRTCLLVVALRVHYLFHNIIVYTMIVHFALFPSH